MTSLPHFDAVGSARYCREQRQEEKEREFVSRDERNIEMNRGLKHIHCLILSIKENNDLMHDTSEDTKVMATLPVPQKVRKREEETIDAPTVNQDEQDIRTQQRIAPKRVKISKSPTSCSFGKNTEFDEEHLCYNFSELSFRPNGNEHSNRCCLHPQPIVDNSTKIENWVLQSNTSLHKKLDAVSSSHGNFLVLVRVVAITMVNLQLQFASNFKS